MAASREQGSNLQSIESPLSFVRFARSSLRDASADHRYLS